MAIILHESLQFVHRNLCHIMKTYDELSIPHGRAARRRRVRHAEPSRRPQRLQRTRHRRSHGVGRARAARPGPARGRVRRAPARSSAPAPTRRGWRRWPGTRATTTCAMPKPAREMFLAINTVPAIVIGRIHGAALGGGSGLAAVCDIVVAEEARDLRVHRNQARHSAGDDLAVRAAEDRRLGGARAVPDRHAIRCRAGQGDRPRSRGRAGGEPRRRRRPLRRRSVQRRAHGRGASQGADSARARPPDRWR